MEGQRIGKWTFLARVEHYSGRQYWRCKCECGTERALRLDKLMNGLSKSCGCSINRGRGHTAGLIRIPNSELRTPTANTYRAMVYRCHDKNHDRYGHYGANGVKVCDRWLGEEGFKNFKTDMGERPYGMTLDRINNLKGYEPGNCRWATALDQASNRRPARRGQAA